MVRFANSAVATAYATTVGVGSDYRVMATSLLTDANGNRSQVVFDALGRVINVWLMGKAGEAVGDDAAHPSVRFEYHLDVIPAFAYVEQREQHFLAAVTNDKRQRGSTYSDHLA